MALTSSSLAWYEEFKKAQTLTLKQNYKTRRINNSSLLIL